MIKNFVCLSIPNGCGDGDSAAAAGSEGETVDVVDDCGSDIAATE